jgi:subtilase family serine protease
MPTDVEIRVQTRKSYNIIPEVNDTNNTFEMNLTRVEKSDLIVSDLTWTPSNFSDGNLITFNAIIENIGTANTKRGFTTRFLIDGVSIGEKSTSGETLGTASVAQTWIATSGKHKIKVVADVSNSVLESNESNNELELNLTKIDPADLIVSDITWTPLSFADGQTVTFNASIKNIGTGNTSNTFYTTFSIDGNSIGTQSYSGGINTGYFATISQTWTATPGDHKIRAVVDIYNQVQESNETNNSLEFNLTKVEQADLTVTDLAWTPLIFSDGQVVTFNATIENIGSGNTTRTIYTRFLIDDSYIGEPYLSGLTTGSSSDIHQTWTVTPGEHKIKAVVDYYNYVSESNETNNTLELNLTKIYPPDLTVSSLTWSPLNFSDGQVVTFNASIINVGLGNSTRNFYTRFLLDGVDIGGPYNDGLASGNSSSVTQTWTATPGDHTIKAVVDYWNSVTESNETNNTLELNLTKIDQADLIVPSINWSPSNFSDGQTVTFNATVANIGAGNTTRGFYTRFFIDGSNIGEQYLSGLASGSSSSVTQTWTATHGEHNVSVIVDYYNYVSESNESNNVLLLNLSKVDQADLTVSGLIWSPSNFSDGQVVTFNAFIENTGAGNTTRGFYTRLLIDDGSIGDKYTSGLSAGSSETITQTWTVTPGEHKIKAVVDVNNYVSEFNESNNTLELNMTGAGLPDYIISNIQVNPVSPVEGSSATINATIKNIGDSTIRTSTYSLLIDGTVIGSTGISGLSSGENRTITYAWAVTPGMHNVTAAADYYNVISEADETNNLLKIDLVVNMMPRSNVTITVHNKTGKIEGANVTLTRLVPVLNITNSDGIAMFTDLWPGTYSLKVETKGHQNNLSTIETVSGETSNIDILLTSNGEITVVS